MGTFIPISIENISPPKEPYSTTYRIDFENKRIRGKITGIEALRQTILKALLTPRFKCLIYDNQYGSEIKSLMTSKDATPEFIEADMPRLVQDALSQDSRILNIRDFSFTFNNDEANIEFTVDTIFGETHISGVI